MQSLNLVPITRHCYRAVSDYWASKGKARQTKAALANINIMNIGIFFHLKKVHYGNKLHTMDKNKSIDKHGPVCDLKSNTVIHSFMSLCERMTYMFLSVSDKGSMYLP